MKLMFSGFLCLLLLSPAAAQNTAPAANRSVVYRTGHEIYRHMKASITDTKMRKSWALYAIGTIAINSADLATSIKGRHRGLTESQPERFFIGQFPSTLKLTLAEASMTMGQLTTLHKLDEMVTDACISDAADPNSRWNHIDALSHDPHSCAWNVPGLGMVGWSYSIAVIVGNINYLDGSKGTTYPAPANVAMSQQEFVGRLLGRHK
jgi:hypothetical protein